MAHDLIFGESPKNWARNADLLADPVIAPAPISSAAKALRQAMDFDSSTLKIRPSGKGILATKIWKWG